MCCAPLVDCCLLCVVNCFFVFDVRCVLYVARRSSVVVCCSFVCFVVCCSVFVARFSLCVVHCVLTVV